MSPLWLSLASTMAALVLVLGLAYAVLRLLRGRLSGAGRGAAHAGADDTLRFVRALPVGPKERVVLVDHRGERWMLGVASGGVTLLARWPQELPAPPASGASDCGQP
ncbi:MAG TPA: flagellar biosynthetic protein FliO [Ideonella sp.]|nr:flagellar biosynthetic protein FliO [Ideonella sp.]